MKTVTSIGTRATQNGITIHGIRTKDLRNTVAAIPVLTTGIAGLKSTQGITKAKAAAPHSPGANTSKTTNIPESIDLGQPLVPETAVLT